LPKGLDPPMGSPALAGNMNTDSEKARILLVDDDIHFLMTVRDFLTFEGFEVATAESGEAALAVLESVHPDLIILDIAMPGMGGIGFLKRILADGSAPRYPVLVLTARTAMENFFEAVEVNGFLPKPCRQDDLLRRTRQILAETMHRPRDSGKVAGATILVGESDLHLATALGDALRKAGYVVEVAETGPAVLEKAIAIRPHAILLQHLLPRLTGGAVCGLLREIPATARIPIILYRDRQPDTSDDPSSCQVAEIVERFVASRDVSHLLDAVHAVLGTSG
jgi:two-component system cell cycle response regulator